MANSTKDDKYLLEQAYMSIYEQTPVMSPKPNTMEREKLAHLAKTSSDDDESEQDEEETVEEQSDDEEPEEDTMSAAVAVQQTADEVEKRGGKMTQQLQKAKQASTQYVDDKISQFKKK